MYDLNAALRNLSAKKFWVKKKLPRCYIFLDVVQKKNNHQEKNLEREKKSKNFYNTFFFCIFHFLIFFFLCYTNIRKYST